MEPQIDLMASWLGKKAINIDNLTSLNWKKELSINEKAYKNYMHSYIKRNGSEELPFWQIFTDRIKKYNEQYINSSVISNDEVESERIFLRK
jgi:hypothetical protein